MIGSDLLSFAGKQKQLESLDGLQEGNKKPDVSNVKSDRSTAEIINFWAHLHWQSSVILAGTGISIALSLARPRFLFCEFKPIIPVLSRFTPTEILCFWKRVSENCMFESWLEEKFENTPISPTPKVTSSLSRFSCLKELLLFWHKKWGKGRDKIDDEDVTFQRMVAKVSDSAPLSPLVCISHILQLDELRLHACLVNLKPPLKFVGEDMCLCHAIEKTQNWEDIIQLTNPAIPVKELGFSNGAVDASRCRRLLENVEVTFMDGAVLASLFLEPLDSDDLLYLKEQMEAEEDAERLLRHTEKRAHKAASLADSAPTLPLPLRVEPKLKSGIRQQDLLKNIVEVRPKRQRTSSPSDGSQSHSPISASQASAPPNGKLEPTLDKVISSSVSVRGEAEAPESETKPEDAGRSLLGLAYESSDED
ncbi:hypothetical protein ACLOJK_014287 [Asimina triloba]